MINGLNLCIPMQGYAVLPDLGFLGNLCGARVENIVLRHAYAEGRCDRDGKFFANRQLTISGTAPEGQEVKGWKLSGAKTEEVSGSELTINMTSSALAIEPVLGTATGIKNVKSETIANHAIYDLMGNKVKNPQAGRIYIQNGKKVMWR